MSERQSQTPQVEALGNGRFAVRLGDTTRVAFAVASSTGTWVWLDGHAYELLVERPSERVAGRHTDEAVMAAPMPATVRTIPVSIGQLVVAGDVVVVLEAMKMELAIKAPRAGTVRAVHCAPGQLVQPGVPLVELDA